MDWGICGTGLQPPDARMRDVMAAQGHLYTLILWNSDRSWDARVIGPISVFGIVTEALARRREHDIPAFTVLSCDNIHGNGHASQRAFTAFAGCARPGLAQWITGKVRFPNCMVDRITRQATYADRAGLGRRFGIGDQWPVLCEPFTQWILEDSFTAGRPPLEYAVVQVLSDAEPYELVKLRLLNAGHQVMCYPGYLTGYRLMHQVASDPLFARFLLDYITREEHPDSAARPRAPTWASTRTGSSSGSPTPKSATRSPGCAPVGAENIIRPDGSCRGKSLPRSGLWRGGGWFLPVGRACCGMMVGCAAPAVLSECDGRVRVTAAAAGERPGQGRGDRGAAPPDRGPAAAAGHDPAAVLPGRPGVPGRPAAPAPPRPARPDPAAGAPRNGSGTPAWSGGTGPIRAGLPAGRGPHWRYGRWCWRWPGTTQAGDTGASMANLPAPDPASDEPSVPSTSDWRIAPVVWWET